ncbi:MAG TPA: serine/threonine-protein kinase [Labilithrix sp.]
MLIDHVIGGKYRITELIGQGGMGTVFEAVHTGTGARVAIKLIVSNDIKEEVFIRFQREARAAGTVDSQHIVKIFDMGTDERSGSPFMVMERLVGEDLSQLMRRVGPLAPEVAVSIIAQAALGLGKAHEAGVVHRDVKPANLFLHDGGDAGEVVVKILDFGIAKVLMDVMQRSEEGGLTRTGSMLGSPHYMSPEQAQGLRSIDRRSDIWSLGVVLYKMLTGQTPHAHLQTLGQVILAICSTPARPVQELAPWVPPEVAMIVHRALQQDPALRWQSAYEMYRAMEPYVAALPKMRRIDILPLSSTQRARIAPPLATINRDGPTNGTQNGMVQSHDALPTKKSSAGVVALVAVAGMMAAIGLAGIGAAVMARRQARADTLPITPTAPLPTSEAIPLPPPALNPTSDKTVQVTIAPANAVVEVEGQKRPVVNGVVELRGAPGAVQNVKVSANGVDLIENVAITENGAIPSKITVSTSTTTPFSSKPTGGRVGSGSGGGGGVTTKPSPQPAGTGVNVQRTFE